MTRQRYSKKEALERILRSLQGRDVSNDAPYTLTGELLSEDEAMSDIAEILAGSLPGYAGLIPYGIRSRSDAVSDSKFFYVIPDHANANDANNGENPAYPFKTIQHAVDSTRAYRGDVIFVTSSDSWQYGAKTEIGVAENVEVPTTKPGIAIVGVGAGSMGTYWSSTGGYCLTVRALDVLVDNFSFWSGAGNTINGIFFDWVGPTSYGENGIVANCTFSDGVEIGIQLDYAWYMKIVNNHFQQVNNYGIRVVPTGSGIDFVEITNNRFTDCAVAMSLQKSARGLIRANYIYNTEAQNGAAATDAGIDTTSGIKNLVIDNYFSCLLPVPAAGDFNDLNTAAATDAWVNNHCMNGDVTGNPT